MAEDADRSGMTVMKARDEREQRRLAGAVQAEEAREGAGRHVEIDAVEGLAGAERVTDVADAEGGRALPMH